MLWEFIKINLVFIYPSNVTFPVQWDESVKFVYGFFDCQCVTVPLIVSAFQKFFKKTRTPMFNLKNVNSPAN